MTSAAHTSLAARLDSLVIDEHVEDGHTEADRERLMLAPRGELVLGSADILEKTLAKLPEGVPRLDLDMSGVVFMDTGGLAFLEVLHGYRDRHGTTVSAIRWNSQPRRILRLAGLDTTDPLGGGADRTVLLLPQRSAASAVCPENAEHLDVLREELEQLRHALTSRPVIDQARGILMATHAIPSDRAWQILREASQLSNIKLRTIAETVTASTQDDGPLPPEKIRTALRTAIVHWSG
ncbi:ANTAR domain-containing protein [Streptomyces sp. NPDC087903]|uniref:ANTAR domain-containing protein n=1 Tax=Streptomyces sp. NPDC087903 TaxID=3365819 RepID=UPI0038206803